MKKDEFLSAVKNALLGMDEEVAADILNDYEIHFKEGMENGKSEEEICEELGNVEEIKQAFLEENPNHAVARPVVEAAENTQIQPTVKPLAKASNEDSEDIYNRVYPGIQRVFAQLISVDVKITKSKTNCVGLSITGKRAEDVEALKETLNITASAGTLTIRQEKKMQIASHGVSGLFGGSFGIFRSADCCIHIELPEKFLQAQIKNVSGDIVAEDVDCENLLIQTVSGDAKVEACKAEHLDVASTSGDIKVVPNENRQCKVKSTSGDCSVTIGNHSAAEITSTSGDISVHYLGGKGLEMTLSTVSGDVSANCGGVSYGGKKKVSASYGEMDSSVKASTVSGDLMVRDH